MRIAFLIIFYLFTLPAQAAERQKFDVTYAMYTGGVRMIDINTNFNLSAKKYTVRTKAATIGIFETLLPWQGVFETSGQTGFKPVRHDYTVTWRGDGEQSTFFYNPAGKFQSMQKTKNGKTEKTQIDADITKGTTDLLTTTIRLFEHFQKTGSCKLDVLTFDNARSFITRFTDAGQINLNNPRLSAYTGPAHGCAVEIIPQKGNWPKKPRGWLRIQQQAKNKLPILWLAKPEPDLPVIPVRVDIHTKYGDVIAHLKTISRK